MTKTMQRWQHYAGWLWRDASWRPLPMVEQGFVQARVRCRRWVSGIFVVAALAVLPTPHAMGRPRFRQDTAQAVSAGGTIAGSVFDEKGQQASDAVVKLQMRDGQGSFQATTDVSGSFVFKNLGNGDYVVSAEKLGVRSEGIKIVLGKTASQSVRLVLGTEGLRGSVASRQEMEFSDKPSFTVAGVTDWTAVGGHGSDATLRTSETLARETVGLKASSSGAVVSLSENGREARLREALAREPESYAATRELGGYYLHAGKYEEAVPLLQAAVKMGGGKAEDEYGLALACRGAGDVAQARVHLQRALAQKDSAEFHELAGELDEKAGDALAAVREFERAARLEGSEENYFQWGSQLLLHRAVWESAEVFGNGVKMYPGSARMKTGWGAALFAGALYEQAAQQLCEASDLNPADTETYLVMGKAEMASPAPLGCVEEKLARFERLQPKNASAVFLHAMALSKQDSVANRARVEGLLKQAVTLDPHYAEAYLQLGVMSFAQRRYPEAIGFYQQAIAADPVLGEAHYRLGVAYDRVGEAEKAKQELRLHDQIETAQADAVEEERRKIKQFLVVQHGAPGISEKP